MQRDGISKLLIANRGEIAIRIAHAAAELDIPSVAVFAEDDRMCLHVRKCDEAVPLRGSGPAAYLDGGQIVALAKEHGCDAIHPGYGFLSENASFARLCAEQGVRFVGPEPQALEIFGDKVAARALAQRAGVPVVPGSPTLAAAADAESFFAALPAGAAMVIKAVAGGGGRGMRVVRAAEEIPEAFQRCQSEARSAFGIANVYAEQFVPRARHVEVQVLGDATGAVTHLWERGCSLQRRHQKLVEIAPAPGLDPQIRVQLLDAAVRIAREAGYTNAGTIEFLVPSDGERAAPGFFFMEANARLQVEHTVTEEVTGLDIVVAQLQLAGGLTLAELGLGQADVPAPRGYAIQARVNAETMGPDGSPRPSSGTLVTFEVPSGPRVRTDTCGYAGYTPGIRFDSLLAKVIAWSPSNDFGAAVNHAYRALCEMRIDGVQTNLPLLQALLAHPEVTSGRLYTTFVDDHLAELAESTAATHPRRFFEAAGVAPPTSPPRAGARVDATDPLAVLDFGKQASQPSPAAPNQAEMAASGFTAVLAPIQGTVVSVAAGAGDEVRKGQALLVMEAMKMEHVIRASCSGALRQLNVAEGDTIYEGHPLAYIEEHEVEAGAGEEETAMDLAYIRPDLAEVIERQAAALDAARPDAIGRRRKTGQRTARENIDDLCDPGTFVEHGSLVLTPGTGLPMEEVIGKFPGDGMVTGIGSVNQALFGPDRSRCVVLSYDYTVLAGTQGAVNHPKTDRMLELAENWQLPVLFFTEGGGGRAGTGGRRQGGQAVGGDSWAGRPLDTPTFATMGRLSGRVPLVGINSGRCFAGNAALLGCCDVIIATANSNIGMGGPAMIEGGGLGVFAPEEVGPMDVQVPDGVVDIAVADEAEAVHVARQYVSYFQGPIAEWEVADQRVLRHIVPEDRLRVYDVREVIDTLCDTGSVLELRPKFGLGMVTAFGRIEGRPIGILANNPVHLAGAIDSDGADKGARFMQLCDAFDIPLLVLCDTPGMMVGPEVEKTALVRHCSRLFVTGANLTIPHFTVVLRKAYGLGAQAMAGGSFKEPFFAMAWPTGEFGGMGLEGQVKLGFRNELAAIEGPAQRLERFKDLVARAYERGKALSYGVSFGVDDVIDPADTRSRILNGLRSIPPLPPRREKKRRNVDTW